MTLKEASIGSTVTVKKITGTGPVKRRIMDMGITKAWKFTPQSSTFGRPGGGYSARI